MAVVQADVIVPRYGSAVRISPLAPPSGPGDAATKEYVDAHTASMLLSSDPYMSARSETVAPTQGACRSLVDTMVSAPADGVPVVVLLGGAAVNGNVQLSLAPPEVVAAAHAGAAMIYQKPFTIPALTRSVNRTNDDGAWVPLSPSAAMVQGGTNAFGIEMPLAAAWTRACPGRPLYIIKLGAPGASLAANPGLGTADSDWSSASGQLFELARDYLVAPALRDILAAGLRPRMLGVLWAAGEADAADDAMSAAYQANLTALVNGIATGFGFPNVSFLAAKLPYARMTYKARVDAATAAVCAAIPGCSADAADGSGALAPFHRASGAYDAIGLLQLGSACTAVFAPSLLGWDTFEGVYDFEMWASQQPLYSALDKTLAGADNPYLGPLAVAKLPTTSVPAGVQAFDWLADEWYTPRPTPGAQPAPRVDLPILDGVPDFEAVVRLAVFGDAMPGLWFRLEDTEHPLPNGYCFQVREGGWMLTVARTIHLATSFLAHGVATPGPSDRPLKGDLYYYRVRMLGTTINVWSCADGKSWGNPKITTTDSTYATGNVRWALVSGTGGSLPSTPCTPFTLLYARSLL